jgi:hypothetical protein
MKKQIQFLLDKIKNITEQYNVFVKYEFNSDIEIHFVQICSKSIKENIIEQIADNLYNEFIESFPSELVAILDDKSKYKFRFEILFDNTQNNFVEISENSIYEPNHYDVVEYLGSRSEFLDRKSIFIDQLIKNLVYSELKIKCKTTYKNELVIPKIRQKSNKGGSFNVDSRDEEYALAA